jgi:hypothetical protein
MIAIMGRGGTGVRTHSLFLCGLLGCLLFEVFLPLFAFLLMLTLLIVNMASW